MPATNLTLFFGHFHPLMVHLPIGLLAALSLPAVGAAMLGALLRRRLAS